MKFWKLTLLTTIAFFGILITIIYSSCERNVCDNVSCYNGGSCSGGTCLCPLGYEGPQCQTKSITRYLGTYVGYQTCDNNAELFDTVTVAADGQAINTVQITSHMLPKTLHGYISSNQATYSIIITNNDSLSTSTTIYNRTFSATVQGDTTLSLVSFTQIDNKTDSINDKCTFLGIKQ